MPVAATPRYDERHNADLADIFHQMAACYRYLGAEHRFRVKAYEEVSRTLNDMKEDISVYASDVETLDKIHGIGESIAQKIMEYLRTGKIKTFESLKKEVPSGLLELMDINGFGPATVKTLHEALHINNKEDLVSAIETGKLEGLRGFGPAKIENMKRGLKLFKEAHSRMLLWDALQTGNEIVQQVLAIPGIKKAALAGSLRRKKETIGDIDVVATADPKLWKKIVNTFISLPNVARVLAKGETKASILLVKTNTQVDLRLVHANEYGAALLYFTGSREHNIELRTWAKSKGWKLNEYGVFDAKSGKRLAGESEEEIYRLFNMQYVPPELREERGEIDTARQKLLPELVEEKDIRGDMQMHSTWSDGAETIATIAQYINREYPRYEYIVITDHSPSSRIAGGLKSGDFLKQFKEIDILNKKLGRPFVKKGVEVDILADGSLDLPDSLLQQFDWVTASIHSGFTKDNTDRLLMACAHPFVHCIGHPSGRLLGRREPYPVNWEKLFDKAVSTGTAIEINAQFLRLDLKDDLVKVAIEKGVTITISTDAHALSQFDFMQLGIAVARRGWCSKINILNTQNWAGIERFRQRKYSGTRQGKDTDG
ncbi:DNA polymerase/3'-5' exonuclease PolX [Flavihumibacter fluvii]|uniref:DNA polymerase/3'-5' exonuclease PolX n=1 Tax=Flavihumibacter fluvii TaxID=2838157 RepID=UPI001BDF178E|nr:DNA polymerase/3'-5' exonuclease PolX [Flavihumibacter fluvii]ULQ54246.1 DNA polymerase/3'-5' exonuclease PolX [Flavihumibacter fluvii]